MSPTVTFILNGSGGKTENPSSLVPTPPPKILFPTSLPNKNESETVSEVCPSFPEAVVFNAGIPLNPKGKDSSGISLFRTASDTTTRILSD